MPFLHPALAPKTTGPSLPTSAAHPPGTPVTLPDAVQTEPSEGWVEPSTALVLSAHRWV